MYRILLADDEAIMLMSLKKMIEENYDGTFEVVTAKTGTAAVSLAQEFHPDIVFMDIHMPGISGIEAIKQIKETLPNTLFVVITAYDKFDYAKEALNLKVFEFLMKPVNKKGILAILQEAMEKLDKDRKNKMDNLRIREKLDTIVPILENGFINNVIMQESTTEEISYYRELLEIEESYAYIMLLQFGEENVDSVLTNPVGMGMRAQKFYGKIRETISESFRGLIGPIVSNKITVMIPCQNQEITYEERVTIIEKARVMRKELGQIFGAHFRIGIGLPRTFEHLNQSYGEASKALMNGKSRINHYGDIPAHSLKNNDYPSAMEEEYYDAIDRRKGEEMKEKAFSILQWLEREGNKLNGIRLKALELVINGEKKVAGQDGIQEMFEKQQDYLEEILLCTDTKEIFRWMNEKLAILHQAMEHSQQTGSVVEQAIQYIKQNYSKDISLNDVSQVVNISPYYFSKLFKEEAGVNFIDYLTDIRMEKAKELLKIPDKSIKEICAMSGYSNANYFSRIFKKVEGITPTEYRDRYL